jgi:hypothetical protein
VIKKQGDRIDNPWMIPSSRTWATRSTSISPVDYVSTADHDRECTFYEDEHFGRASTAAQQSRARRLLGAWTTNTSSSTT